MPTWLKAPFTLLVSPQRPRGKVWSVCVGDWNCLRSVFLVAVAASSWKDGAVVAKALVLFFVTLCLQVANCF